MKLASRTDKLTPFIVMELLEKARTLEARGEDIVHMEIGEPDFPSPKNIKQAGIDAIQNDRTLYTHSLGIPELRKRLAEWYKQRDGVSISPERIIVTNGTSGAFLLLCAVLLEREKTLALSDPGYPCYKNFASLFDADVCPIPVSGETLFEVTPDSLRRASKKPNVLIISNPVNPTGTVYRESTINDLHQAMLNYGGVFIVDEIYRGLTYEKKVPTALSISDRIVVVDGLSKSHAMTGWRIGWMVVPKEFVRPAQIVGQNVFISAPTISQYAALDAFDTENDLARMKQTYRERRNFLLPRLKDLGFHIPVDPEGAFYIYAGIERWGIDSRTFADRALTEAKVALTPGYDFGVYRAGSHVRFSYATGIDRLKQGCDRLEKWLNTL